jgi:hypothetical protein
MGKPSCATSKLQDPLVTGIIPATVKLVQPGAKNRCSPPNAHVTFLKLAMEAGFIMTEKGCR